MITSGEIELGSTKRGWAVHLRRPIGEPRFCGWVQATRDNGWRAIDADDRVRVQFEYNRMNAAIKLADLVWGE